MGWFSFSKKRRSVECKSMATVSLSPTLHLLVIFGIVITLLWLSNSSDYKAHQSHNHMMLLFLMLLSPIVVLILFLASYSASRRFNFHHLKGSEHVSLQQRSAVVSPFKVAILLLLLLLMLSYQSSFQSKWFGPF